MNDSSFEGYGWAGHEKLGLNVIELSSSCYLFNNIVSFI
jgi:hypothetical protein